MLSVLQSDKKRGEGERGAPDSYQREKRMRRQRLSGFITGKEKRKKKGRNTKVLSGPGKKKAGGGKNMPTFPGCKEQKVRRGKEEGGRDRSISLKREGKKSSAAHTLSLKLEKGERGGEQWALPCGRVLEGSIVNYLDLLFQDMGGGGGKGGRKA